MRWPWRQAEAAPPRAEPAPPPGIMLASDHSPGTILGYVGASGATWPLDLYTIGAGGGAGGAVNFATFMRCITLLSAIAAQVVTSGSLRVVGPDGKERRGYRANRAIDLLTGSPNGVDPAHTFVEEVMADLLVSGNALVRIERAGGRVAALRRIDPVNAYAEQGRNGEEAYFGRLVDSPDDVQVWTAAADVAHARWPRVGLQSGIVRRFALAPVAAIRPALEIGRAGDEYIRSWFSGGGAHKAQIGITYPARLNPEMHQEVRENLANYKNSTDPLVIGGGGQFTNLGQRAQHSDSASLRSYQVRDVARIYGVPGPLLGEDVTAWGAGIEQLAKLAWRFGAKQHTDRLLAALSFRLLDSRLRFRIDDVELLRGSATEIAQLVTATVGDSQRPAIATVTEARRWLGLPADAPGLDAEIRPAQEAAGNGETTEE